MGFAIRTSVFILLQQAPAAANATTKKAGHHRYYNTTVVTSPSVRLWWGPYLALEPSSEGVDRHGEVRGGEARWVELGFGFPFYGYELRRLGISPKGFRKSVRKCVVLILCGS